MSLMHPSTSRSTDCVARVARSEQAWKDDAVLFGTIGFEAVVSGGKNRDGRGLDILAELSLV